MPTCNFKVVILVFIYLQLTKGQNINNSTQESFPKHCKPTGDALCLQKCLKNGTVFQKNDDLKRVQYNSTLHTVYYAVYDSNETHIRTDSYTANISIYKGVKRKTWLFFDMENIIGITGHNMSAILVVEGNVHLVPLQHYCVEYLLVDGEINETNVGFLFDPDFFKTEPVRVIIKEAALYFPFILLSCISFFISAFFYLCVLNMDDRNNKKCFVGYTISMGLSFLSLVLLQKINDLNYLCNTVGGLLLLCTIAGFVWFTFLCLDLVLDIIYFENGYHVKTLWIIYTIASIVISVVVTITSIGETGTPGIPHTFIKRYETNTTLCSFKDSNNAAFFVPIGTALLFSLICICLALYHIRKNNDHFRDHFLWLDNSRKYKYMCISCILMWVTLTVWIVNAGINSAMESSFENLALDLIEALQGIFAVLIFVSDRYTRKDLKKKCRRGSRTDESVAIQLGNAYDQETRNETTTLMLNNPQSQD